MNLRPYQIKLVNDIRDKIQQGYKRILCQCPTGGGKTVIASYIILNCIAKNNTAIMSAPVIEICNQICDTLDVPYGKIMAGVKMDLHKPMQVASILTLRSRKNNIPIPTILIVDECQHSVSPTWQETIDYFSSRGSIILGLSATPHRLSGESLGVIFETMVQGPTVRELINIGALSNYKYYAPDVKINTQKIKITCGDYNKKELEFVVNKNTITGDVIEHYNKLISGKRAIVFCVSVDHAKQVAEQFALAGFSSAFIEGKMSVDERSKTLQNFKDGKILVLTNVEIATEGVDIPAVESVIMLRPTLSESLYLQMVGRALRRDPNNPDKVAIILDHVNNVNKHGLPDADREWSLDSHKRTRASEKSVVGIRTCPKCYGCHKPINICPYCGYEYNMSPRQLAQEAGTLKEFDAEQAEKLKRQKKIELWSCKTISDLEKLAEERGYARSWVHIQAKIRHIYK